MVDEKHNQALDEAMKLASEEVIADSIKYGTPRTVLEGTKIVRIFPDGRVELVRDMASQANS